MENSLHLGVRDNFSEKTTIKLITEVGKQEPTDEELKQRLWCEKQFGICQKCKSVQ